MEKIIKRKKQTGDKMALQKFTQLFQYLSDIL